METRQNSTRRSSNPQEANKREDWEIEGTNTKQIVKTALLNLNISVIISNVDDLNSPIMDNW